MTPPRRTGFSFELSSFPDEEDPLGDGVVVDGFSVFWEGLGDDGSGENPRGSSPPLRTGFSFTDVPVPDPDPFPESPPEPPLEYPPPFP